VELVARAACHKEALRAQALTKWILDQGYATEEDGLLVPTAKTAVLGWALPIVPVIDA
jgi:hypothetical protein